MKLKELSQADRIKGGENVQIERLGALAALLGEPKGAAAENNLFKGIMEASLNGAVPGESMNTKDPASLFLSQAETESLSRLLSAEDVIELEDGVSILDRIMDGNEEDFALILDILNLDENQLKDLVGKLQSLLAEMNEDFQSPLQSIVKKTQGNIDEKGLEQKEAIEVDESPENESGENVISSLLSSLSLLLQNKPEKIFNKLEAGDLSNALKFLKAYDLVAQAKGDFPLESKLNSMLKEMVPIAQQLIVPANNQGRNTYLQNLFTQVSRELNANLKINSTESSGSGQSNIQVKEVNPGLPFFQLNQMTKPEQLSLMMEKQGKQVSADDLIQQFESILSKSQFTRSGGIQKLFLKLYPEHLGSLRIELIQKDSTVMAKILTSTGSAKDLLESQTASLKHALGSQNIQVDKIEIALQTGNGERAYNREGSGSQQNRQSQKESEAKEQNENFNDALEEVLLNTEV
nr:flagellar hook-length control protein FliK [Bacillus infantis]